jgi:hypothetical protein
VKNLKVLILVFGILGIISMFIPVHGFTLFSLFKLMGTGQLALMVLSFGLPAAMGGMAVAKPPMQKWQGGVALAGFALGCVKLRVWEALGHFGELTKMFPMLLIVIAAIGGVVVSILSLVKGEAS